jgi:hypothetical protein
MITARQAEAFWSVVADCLVRFHGYPAPLAQEAVAGARSFLAQARAGVRTDMVFHAEPFDVASTIADNPLSRFDFEEAYAAMMDAAFPARPRPLAVGEQRAGYGT